MDLETLPADSNGFIDYIGLISGPRVYEHPEAAADPATALFLGVGPSGLGPDAVRRPRTTRLVRPAEAPSTSTEPGQ